MKPSHAPQASVSKPWCWRGRLRGWWRRCSWSQRSVLHRSQPALMGLEKRQMLFLRAGGGCLPSFKADRTEKCLGCVFFCVVCSNLRIHKCGITQLVC